jgi:hypothetical protein
LGGYRNADGLRYCDLESHCVLNLEFARAPSFPKSECASSGWVPYCQWLVGVTTWSCNVENLELAHAPSLQKSECASFGGIPYCQWLLALCYCVALCGDLRIGTLCKFAKNWSVHHLGGTVLQMAHSCCVGGNRFGACSEFAETGVRIIRRYHIASALWFYDMKS